MPTATGKGYNIPGSGTYPDVHYCVTSLLLIMLYVYIYMYMYVYTDAHMMYMT